MTGSESSFCCYYRPQTKSAKDMFSQVFVCPQGVSVQGVSVQGGLCSGGLCPGGLCLGGVVSVRGWWSLSRGFLSKGVSVQGGLCSGGLCPGGLCLGGVVSVRGGWSLPRGSLSGRASRTVTCGWYASCWNAFLYWLLLHCALLR